MKNHQILRLRRNLKPKKDMSKLYLWACIFFLILLFEVKKCAQKQCPDQRKHSKRKSNTIYFNKFNLVNLTRFILNKHKWANIWSILCLISQKNNLTNLLAEWSKIIKKVLLNGFQPFVENKIKTLGLIRCTYVWCDGKKKHNNFYKIG